MTSAAIILAAGRGQRLGGKYSDLPKGLIDAGGITLMERSVACLQLNGIRDVTIVTGHCSEAYDRFAAGYGGGVRCVYNPNFVEYGTLLSLIIGMSQVDSDFLLLDSDIIYESRAISALQSNGAASAMVVSDLSGSGDEIYAWATSPTEGGRHLLAGLSKDRNARDAAPLGEHIGIVRVSRDLRAAAMATADAMLNVNPLAPYEDWLVAQVGRVPVSCLLIEDLVWAEIDNQDMLDRVLLDVCPRIDLLDADM